MKNIVFVIIALSLFSCGKEQKGLTVKAHIKGLKKGTVYLKYVQDSTLITVDSVNVDGQSLLELQYDIKEPDMFYLYLDKNTAEDNHIAFFADKGLTEINTSLKYFIYDAKINGSSQQKSYEDYKKVISRFNKNNLDLIKENFEAYKRGDSAQIANIKKKTDNNTKRKYLYTVNFALNNRDSELAPYLAVNELYNARIDLLDTINNTLTPKVKVSKYGKKLDDFIQKIKQNSAAAN